MVSSNHYDLDIDTTLGGSNASDYVVASQKAIKDYVDNHTGSIPNPAYGTSSTAAATAQKVVSIPAITSLNVGQVLYIRPSTTSTVANSTIKLNDFDPYPMRYNNAAITTSTDSVVWGANFVSIFVFDGSYWQFAGHGIDSNTTYSAMSVSEGTTGTATSSRVMRADYLKSIIQGTKLTGLDTTTNSEVVATDNILGGIGKLQAQINASKILINITYDDLVTLKTNGELYEGAFYRIVDFVTTCNAYTPRSGEPSRSAGHQFDIIIQALSTSTLADKGTASLHSGDTYFANSNLGAWQIWYDIENDTNKYKWADTTNGKGVIYRLIDERNNDLPYDFKNIQFYRNGSSSSYTSVATYLTATDGYYYTFSLNTSGTISDYSIDGGSYCQKNIHGALGVGQGIGLPNSVWIETATAKELSNNDIGSNSYNNTCCGVFQRIHCPLGAFTNNITNDTFRNSVIASNFKNNVIGTSFDNNEIGHWFTNNTIGTNFKLNSVGESVRYCTFGNTTQYSQIGNYVTYITFGDSFNTGVIQNYINYISIPNKIYNLTIKNNTSGTSTNPLSLSGLPTEVNYSVTVRLDSNSGYIATWNDGITTYGKYKATSGTATWTDVNNKQIQADWSQSDSTAVDYIKNKPTIPSDLSALVRQETTDTITLYAWYDSSATPDTVYTTTLTVGSVNCLDSNSNFVMTGNIMSSLNLQTTLAVYTRDTSKDTTFIRQTLTDNNSNALNIVQADGKWVQSFVTIMESNGTKSGVQIDLSSYLPDDSFDYNVKFKLQGYDDDSTYYYRIETDIFDDGFTTTGSSIGVQLYGGTYSRQNVNIFDLPVGTGRYIKVYGSGADTINIYALGYRRLGTNN